MIKYIGNENDDLPLNCLAVSLEKYLLTFIYTPKSLELNFGISLKNYLHIRLVTKQINVFVSADV